MAHLFLYGLLKDFFSIWSDSSAPASRADYRPVHGTGTEVKYKAAFAWPAYITSAVQQRAKSIQPTRQCSIAGATVCKYAEAQNDSGDSYGFEVFFHLQLSHAVAAIGGWKTT